MPSFVKLGCLFFCRFGHFWYWILRWFFLVLVMVARVIKSFDTVDNRSILDCALGRLGLPDWF